MAIIGDADWQWVDPETAGVPTDGRYGDVARFREAAQERGLDIAWSRLWECFFLYEMDGAKVKVHFQFFIQQGHKVMPLNPDWLDVFDYCRERWSELPFHKALAMLNAKRKYERQREREAMYEAMTDEVMPRVTLAMKTRTPRATVAVPALPWRN